MDLALHQQRVDDGADVIHHHVFHHVERTGVRIDFDLADVAAVRERRLVRRGDRGRAEPITDVVRQRAGAERELGHVLDADVAVGAGHGERAVGEFDVALVRLQRHGGEELGALDHQIGGATQRRAARHQRARAERATAMAHLIGIAEHVAHPVRIDAEEIDDHLPERGLVALAVIVRAEQHGDVAVRVELDFRAFVAGIAERPAGNFDRMHDADAAQLAAAARFGAALLEAVPVGVLQRHGDVAGEVAGIVGEHQSGLERQLLVADHIAPAQRHAVDPHVERGLIDHPLDGEGRLRPPRAAIGRRRLRMGVDALHLDVDMRRAIDAGEPAEIVGHRMRRVER